MAALLLMLTALAEREVVTEKVVRGTPQEVFALWSSADGVRTFFAPGAAIEPRAGGEYTILFAPQQDPEGTSHGTKGARIRVYEPGQRLVFEWIPFTARDIPGMPGPPLAPPAVRRNSITTVELTFTPKGRARTRVRLRHGGFRSGPLWDASHAYFSRVWPLVLESLARRCELDRSPGLLSPVVGCQLSVLRAIRSQPSLADNRQLTTDRRRTVGRVKACCCTCDFTATAPSDRSASP